MISNRVYIVCIECATRIYNKIFLSLVVWQLVKYHQIKVLINEISLPLHIFENYFAPTKLYNKCKDQN